MVALLPDPRDLVVFIGRKWGRRKSALQFRPVTPARVHVDLAEWFHRAPHGVVLVPLATHVFFGFGTKFHGGGDDRWLIRNSEGQN